MARDTIKPTRSELMEVKRKIKLSATGHKLLKMKRDGLMYELFEILPKVKGIRANLTRQFADSSQKMAIAQAIEGRIALASLAHTQQTPPTVKVGEKNIMGVVVPTVSGESVRKKITQRGYGIIGTSPHVDLVVDGFEALLEEIIRAAELETTMKKLLEDIEKTKRRVNALEFKVIPELKEIAAFITLRLEEIERENVFRLKKIKGKGRKKKAAAAQALAGRAGARGAVVAG